MWMSYFEAVYVRASMGELQARFEEILPQRSAVVHSGAGWLRLTELEPGSSWRVAQLLAQNLKTRALALSSQSVMDFFELTVFSRSGYEVRRLAYAGGGNGWDVVDGSRQRWEAQLFDHIEADDALLLPIDRRVLSEKRLLQGARQPRTSAHAVGAAIGLPGFGATPCEGAAVRLGSANPALYGGLLVALLLALPFGFGLIFYFMTTPSLLATFVAFGFLGVWSYTLRWIRRFATPVQRP